MNLRSSDPNALRRKIRCGKRARVIGGNPLVGALMNSARTPYRVAGSLVPSRAIGDEYLKHGKYSCWPFKTYLPYITHKPQVRSYRVEERNDAAGDELGNVPVFSIVVASDGLWDLLSNDTAGMLALGWTMMEGRGLSFGSSSSSSTAGCEGDVGGIGEASGSSQLSTTCK